MAKKKPTEIQLEDTYLGDQDDEDYADDPSNIDPEEDSEEFVEQPIEVVASNKVIGSTKSDPTRMTSSTPDYQKPGTVKEKRARFAEGTVVRTRTDE